MKRYTTLIAGCGAVLAGILLRYVPLLSIAGRHVSDSQVHALCSSTLGTLAQVMDQAASNDCSGSGALFVVTELLVWGGGVVAAAGLVALMVRAGARPPVPPPPPVPPVMTSAEDGYR